MTETPGRVLNTFSFCNSASGSSRQVKQSLIDFYKPICKADRLRNATYRQILEIQLRQES